MFVVPNSTIQIFQNVLLDKEHKHTAYFPSRSAQDTYFSTTIGSDAYILESYTFLKDDESINVALSLTLTYATVSQCNYLRFKNTAFYNKWFYAFIDRVELVNVGCAKIYFTLDVMQTWLCGVDYAIEPCFIAREHAYSDHIGSNLIEENLEIGDYIYGREQIPVYYDDDEQSQTFDLSNLSLIVAMSEKIEITESSGVTIFSPTGYGGCCYWGKSNIAGLQYIVFENTRTGIREFNQFMGWLTYAGKVDEVFAIFWYPTLFTEGMNDGEIPTTGDWTDFGVVKNFNIEVPADFKRSALDPSNNIDGYVPRNNKLFTYPYNFLCAVTPTGSKPFKYEYFRAAINPNDTAGYCYFSVFGALSPNGTIQFYPVDYKGHQANESVLMDEAVEVGGYPTIPYNTDLAKAYMAQWNAGWNGRVAQGIVQTAGGALLGAASGVTYGGPLGAVAGATTGVARGGLGFADQIFDHVIRKSELEVSPVRSRGFASDVTTLQAKGQTVRFVNKHIRAEFARIVDDYFTVFGYACNRTKDVSIHNRENYTYVKTIGAHLGENNMPHNFEEEICSIFNNGITFWVNASYIGDYSRSNRPLGDLT